MNRWKMLSVVLLSGVLLVMAPNAEAQNEKRIKMTFEVEDGALVLKPGLLSTTRADCTRANHPGCYNIESGSVGKFRMRLKKGDNACSDPDAWRFHSVVLGGEGSVDNPPDKPTGWGNISQEAADDFDADRNTGIVNTVTDGDEWILFDDQNNHSLSIWYKVIVAQCSSGAQLEYDPRVDNKG